MLKTDDALAPPDVLGRWLAARTGDSRWQGCRTSLVAGGKSNLTFRLTSPAGDVILRRPPAGGHELGSHDVAREARVQRALADTAVPVPEVVATDDGELLGVPVTVTRVVDGHCIRDTLPTGYAPDARHRHQLAYAMVDVFATLHDVDPTACGLADLGRPDGFVQRQVDRWRRQWDRDRLHEVAAVRELGVRLSAALPSPTDATVVHGDCKLDNLLMDTDDPSVVRAVLDWEMSTYGDPLTDLALMLLFWRQPGEKQLTIAPAVSDLPGFPSRADLVERYASRRPLDERHLAFHQGLAHLKFAVILQGIARRSRAGAMAGQDYDDADAEVELVAVEGLKRLGGSL